ncbi:mandelate racemase/muconate lactonizing enzyme family protein [Marasmitruncus massiliensis]|uniref:mandelate racemase/muconate lactonizing enzyme family protein n=1 Tax=Marasmitruncus massiliensis TaxID=1944642 RepID=UPI000C7D7D63|nr:mandelate racemase/muconate lactonizing enzyme family protein [Marasmitruncus massiliensis]
MESMTSGINTNSSPSQLRITDMRFVDIVDAPMECTILRLETNQGITGYGEVRDFSNKVYALQLKRLIVGENPCNIGKIFNKIKQFGGQARQGGGVSGIEVALCDLAGKAFGVPVYQMLGGKFRDKIRIYCDTDVGETHNGNDMSVALQKRMDSGYTMLKMDLGIDLLVGIDGTINAPLGYLDRMRDFTRQEMSFGITDKAFAEFMSVPHPFTFVSLPDKGLDYLEEYMSQVRDIIGYEVPLAIDHIGHVNVQSCIRLGKRLEKYNIAWMEDCVPWFYTDQWKQLSNSCAVPMCTGEDTYLCENFMPLFRNKAISVIHPDVLTAGGIYETKKIIDTAWEHGIAAAIHMAETPIGCMAAAHVSAAVGDNFVAMEFHSHDVPWWNNMVKGAKEPIIQNGWLTISDKPGLGIDELDDEVLRAHMNPKRPGLWESTDTWNQEWAHDRTWS